MYQKCWCGCDNFYIMRKGKHILIKCPRCKAERIVNSPGIAVDDYSIGPPFAEEIKGETK